MARAKGNGIIDEFYCKGCELCVSVCPKDILALDETRLNISGYNPCMVTDMGECIACANCAKMCPEAAITVEKCD